MNILFYIPGMDKKWGGVYQYSYGVLRILSEIKEETFNLYCLTEDEETINLVSQNKNIYVLPINLLNESFEDYKRKRNRVLINKLFRKLKISFNFKIQNKLDDIIDKYKIDLIHCPYQHLPDCKVPVISTMHDVQELYFPEFFSSAERARRAVEYKKAIDKSKAVVVSYNHVKEDLIKFFEKPKEEIFTILLDMQNLWFDEFNISMLNETNKFNIQYPFVLYPAASWAHKNHLKLIEAIYYLKSKKNKLVNLVCTGHLTEFYYTTIQPKVNELGLSSQVQFLGAIENIDLYNLYQKCQGVVVPTLYEAGSFPLMESILMNIPVVCSNATSLPETIGNKKFIFDPQNVEDIGEKILGLFDKDFVEVNKMNSFQMAGKLRNNNALEKFIHLYKYLIPKKINFD